MIEVRDLRRSYGGFEAVRGVSFTAGEGEILGMLGPNGAGKTTIIRMITGFLPPSSGTVAVAGLDLLREPLAARRRIGYLPETVSLYPEMRVREYLFYRAHLQGLVGAAARRQVDEHVERCLLGEVEEQIIGTLSKGYRQRVGLAAAILHDPPVLVLDEPTVGLDPKQIIAIRELIRELGRRRTVLLSTHILPEVELLCDRVQILDRGRILAEGTAESLEKEALGNPTLDLSLRRDAGLVPAAVHTALAAVPEVVAVRDNERRTSDDELALVVEWEAGADLRDAVFRCALEHGWVLRRFALAAASLEDVFVRLTRDEDTADAGGEGTLPVDAPPATRQAPEAQP
jgi:ABC-2 type transport system ATP-binding protein